MTTYDRTYEYRADFDGHEFAGHVIATNINEAIDTVGFQADRYGASSVDVRLLAEVSRTTCCQRGDWHGADHQPSDAELFVPVIRNIIFRGERKVVFLPDTNWATYRWTCEYCGRTGTREDLNTYR